MQLTKRTDYAFRALIYLASMNQDLTNIQRLADDFSLSKSHLMKIVNELVRHGWVEAVRGKYGGIRLGVEPESISVKDVVVLMEPNLEPVNCMEPPCVIYRPCILKGVLRDARDSYLDYLANYTVADLLDNKTTRALRFSP